MKTKILKTLRSSEEFVSGQQLCQDLGVSRTAVWKNIKQLKEEGYQIEAVQNKGYRIVKSPDVITAEEIRSLLPDSDLEVFYKEEISSTNTWAKQIAEDEQIEKALAVTNQQTGGKGRRGRAWSSEKGTDIAMTLMMKPQIDPSRASMLTLVMGLSVAQAVQETTGLKAQIKWPNDVVVSDKKVCGILTEMSAQIDYINYIVIGIGINVNTLEFPEEIQSIATSLAKEAGSQVKRAPLIAACMKAFEHNFARFMEHEDLSSLMEIYNQYLINTDKEIRVLQPGDEYDGIARGINHMGELLVETGDGSIKSVYAGEVSVRGLYGYV